MLFCSFSFLFGFLPAVLALYFLLPPLFCRAGVLSARGALFWRNLVLFFASLAFYGWGEPVYILLMLVTVAANYGFGLWTARARRPRAVLWAAAAFDLGLLFFFKYAAFFAGLFGLSVRAPRLPLGISFYTFQALSYVADVYRRDVTAERSPLRFGTYVALFPQLVAGPIVRYRDVAGELRARRSDGNTAAAGARRFAAGLAKKVLLANPAGALFAAFSAQPHLTAARAWLALAGFSFQIYFDFSGYSDMAIGLGLLFGFRFPENFRYPYTALSFTDFWRRWHITLSAFFREYVYIPLGGNRKGKARTVLNLLIVWVLTGLWHGAAWNFLLWGAYWFLLLAGEKFLWGSAFARLPAAARHAVTLTGILFGWLLFAFDGGAAHLSFAALGSFLAALGGRGGAAFGSDGYDLLRHLPFLLICAFGCTSLPKRIYGFVSEKTRFEWMSFALPAFGFVAAVAGLAAGGYNPFLYFRF